MLNAHHVSSGALIKRLFGDLYDYDSQTGHLAAESHRRHSPHNKLTSHMQPSFKAVHENQGICLTYGMIRDRASGADTVKTPEIQIREAIRAQDAIVFDMIKHLPEAEQRKLLGVMERYY